MLDRVLSSLFPGREGVRWDPIPLDREELEENGITPGEVLAVIKLKGSRNTAPGGDGIRLRAIRCIPTDDLKVMADCFTQCLREEVFPKEWKRVSLVLIQGVAPG